MKVRDCFSVAPQVRTILLATRYRAPGEPDDSRIATQPLHGEPGILSAFDPDFGQHGKDITVERMLAAKLIPCKISVP